MLNLVANGPSGYNLSNSLRFRSSASAYLNRTFITPTNNKIFTLSAWVKRGSDLGTQSEFFDAGTSNTNYVTFQFDSSNRLAIISEAPTLICQLRSTQVFRDPAAWYHIVLSVDTTQATASNRIKMYVNGNQITAFDTATYPTQNTNLLMNSAIAHYFAKNISGANYYDGYTTEVNFIDGQQLTPSSFGSTNSLTGVWQPAKYTGTYGTNGFYLNFSNIALTSGSNTGLGKDYSGNGNYWNTNNISVTSGVTYDAMTDVPTLTSATVANYAVINPIGSASADTYSQANLKWTKVVNTTNTIAIGSIAISSGKWYWEGTVAASGGSNLTIGIGNIDTFYTSLDSNLGMSGSTTSYAYNGGTGPYKQNNNTQTSYGATFTTNDVIGVAFDADAGTLTFYKNNVSQGTAYTGITGTYYPACGGRFTNDSWYINFGQRPFTYTPPTGYVALNTYNLPTSTIVQGNKYFNVNIWTGNGTSQAIVNSGSMQPDLMWTKSRSVNGYYHVLIDSVRGITKALYSNATDAENTLATRITSINSNGYTVGSSGDMNDNAQTFVGWQWQAGQGSTSSNTNGSITSTVSVNASAGFSVVTWTSDGFAGVRTMGHGLGVAPKMIIAKDRTAASTLWFVYHTSLASDNKYLQLQSTAAVTDASPTQIWSTSSTTFGIRQSSLANNGDACVAYCWAAISGFSAFGSYTGNGSADGSFIYTGFQPAFVLIKVTSTADEWVIFDNKRPNYNATNLRLNPNSSGAEQSTQSIDILSNGFKARSTGANINQSGATYIYACFASNPFRNSNAF